MPESDVDCIRHFKELNSLEFKEFRIKLKRKKWGKKNEEVLHI